jgi:prepilin-type N-terminal cleavage/methylation domain-containing protein
MNKGFTLIEVVISIGIFAILAYAGTTFFIQAVKDNSKVSIENEIRETAAGIIADVGSEVRGLVSQTSSGQYCFYKSLDNLTVYLSDSPPGTLNCAANSTRQIIYKSDPTTGIFTKQVNSGTVVQLNSARAFVAACSGGTGACLQTGCTPGFLVSYNGSSTALNVDLYVQQNTAATKSEFCAKTRVTQTITPRTRP